MAGFITTTSLRATLLLILRSNHDYYEHKRDLMQIPSTCRVMKLKTAREEIKLKRSLSSKQGKVKRGVIKHHYADSNTNILLGTQEESWW